MRSAPPLRTRSISNDLTRILLCILAAVACVALSLSYIVSTHRAKQTLEQKADEYIASLTDILTIPLWSLDRETVAVIGKTYLQNEFISTLTISSRNISLALQNDNSAPTGISREEQVVYFGEILGTVRISLTPDYNTSLHRQFFWSYSLTIFVMLLFLFFLTEVLLQQFLQKPLYQFIELVNAYAAGNRDAFTQQISYREFQPLTLVLKDMGETISSHQTHLESLVQQRTRQLESQAAELREAKDLVEAASRVKSAFFANISHELRTPMNAILGFAQLLTRDSSLNAAQQEKLGVITRSGEHLLSLISDVLDMSKIEAGRLSLKVRSFDLWHALATIEEMMRVRAEYKNLTLVVCRDPNVPRYIATDEGKLRQVLLNLLSNAIKFTETGSVTLKIENWEKEHHRPASIVNLQFSITDTGIGIAPEEQNIIFEPFGRTDYSQDYVEGTGLGLAISREIVNLMGGDIRVESSAGQGARFSFEIGVEVATPVTAETTRATGRVSGLAPGQPVYRILVVEDTWESRAFLTELLRSVGFHVEDAGNGAEAVRMFERQRPHLIWMDMRMPIMDGYTAIRQIRELEIRLATADSTSPSAPRPSKIPIIALTASTFEEKHAAILAIGCDDILYKPFREHDIFAMMQTYLGVQYVYAEREAVERIAPLADVTLLWPASLAKLPAELLTRLEDAVERSSKKQITAIIEEIRAHHAQIANALTHLADDFKYDDILTIIQNTIRIRP